MRSEKGGVDKHLFPLFVDLSEKKILLVGGGTIAGRRAKVLTDFCHYITVVARQISDLVEELEKEGKVNVKKRDFVREDLYGADMVIAATDDHRLNDEIYSVCKCLGILVNVVSDQEKCDFHFPGVLLHEDLVVGINAGGRNHRLAKETRIRIQAMLGGKEE